MISTNKRRLYGEIYNDVRCLSTDEKPTDVKNGSTLVEIDTGDVYMFDAEGVTWNQLPSSGGGGGNEPQPSSMTPKMDGTASSGSSLLYARADHVHPTDTSRASTDVATTSANGLMSATDKRKLGGIESGANAYTLPTMSATTKGGAKLGDGLAIEDGALGIDPAPQESTGAVRGAISSLTAKGWATQDGTPTPSSPVPISVARGRNLLDDSGITTVTTNGITFTRNEDGSISAVGTATALAVWSIVQYMTLPAGTYTVSGGIANKATVELLSNAGNIIAADTGGGKTFTLASETSVRRVRVNVGANTTIDATIYPQLELGSTPTPYVPYGHVGIDITHGGTTTTIPVPLPAKGYAASLPDGTADVLTIDGAGRVEWLSAVNEVVLDGSETWLNTGVSTIRYATLDDGRVGAPTLTNSMCDRYIISNASASTIPDDHYRYGTTTSANLYVSDSAHENMQSWTDWLAQNPVTVLYPLATPVTEQCGYIDWPSIPDGATVTCPELDALGVRYLIGNGVAEMAREWYERGHAEAQATSTALGELAQSVLEVDGKADAVAAQLVVEDVFNGINLNATDVPNANISVSGSLLRVLDIVYLSLRVFTIDEDITVDVNGVTVFTFEGRAMPTGQYTADYVFASLQTNIPGVSAYVMRSGEVRLAGDGYVIEAGTSFADSGITITGTYPLIPSGN